MMHEHGQGTNTKDIAKTKTTRMNSSTIARGCNNKPNNRKRRRTSKSNGPAMDSSGESLRCEYFMDSDEGLPVAGNSYICSRCRGQSQSVGMLHGDYPPEEPTKSTKTMAPSDSFPEIHSRQRRHAMKTLDSSTTVASKLSMSRMTLLLLYLGVSTATYMETAVTASSLESVMKTPIKNRRVVEPTQDDHDYVNNDVLQENLSDVDEEDDENDDNIDVDYAVDDDVLKDILSDFDHSLHISEENIDTDQPSDNNQYDISESTQPIRQKNPKIKVRSQGSRDGSNNEDPTQSSTSGEEEKDSVIILSAVDGTLAGISRTSGQILWKQSRDMVTEDDTKRVGTPPVEWNKFLSPLVSTTTKSSKSDKNLHEKHHQWHAVPSIDGTVYLTGGDDGDGGSNSRELSMSTHIRDLVDRAPFVDVHQRFFVGSRRAMVAAVDEKTGEILRVIPKWKQDTDDDSNEDELPPSLEGRDVVWIGRLEHTVTVHDLHKGTVDIEFSVAEILSVDEMIHGTTTSDRARRASSSMIIDEGEDVGEDEDDELMREEAELERLFTDYITEALRHPSFGDRILTLPAPDESDDEEDIYANVRGRTSGSSISQGSAFLVSTPSGNVAFRDDSDSSTVGWVSFHLLDSPVVYAIEASSGHKIRVNMLDDSSVSGSNEDGSLPHLLQQQIASIEQAPHLSSGMVDEECSDDKAGECRAVGFSTQGSVVGALHNGQIYALPLGERVSRPQLPLGLPQPHSIASDMVNVKNNPHDKHPSKLSTHHAIGFHNHRHDSSGDVDSGDKKPIHLDFKNKQSCTPESPLYPGCLIGASLMLGNLLDVDGNLDMASVFASSDLDYDLYLDMLAEGTNQKKNSTYFQQFTKIMSSWIAPTVALIFVLSFEMGRRERLKAEAAKNGGAAGNADSSGDGAVTAKNGTSNSQGGVIQLSDEILGYGGHGTIVYRGVLDKRQVAVKRLLATYHASADREISLLIESDGHPNVVRYFLKEMRGEFVYLALELCDMSLNDLIVSLGKLRNARRENFQFTSGGMDADDFESATKSLLYQIASGVRHIHSLRIVHRDLKPQNILLALRGKSKPAAIKPEESGGSTSDSDTEIDDTTHSFCSDTNSILESFKNQDYVPKISDMGLGKQLSGQSSFGLSTLGTGSVGGGAAGEAGAGAGSVGWQAPEVMAQRWSPEISSNNNETSESLLEASPLESGVSNRTSRSVDIFSLGCIFYCTILPGSHPFGEWYEREANIMKNSPNRDDLEFVSPDATDLILSMINRDAKARPTAEEVCQHPFFWSPAKRLKFLCELSDRIELCDTSNLQEKDGESKSPMPDLNIFAIEKGATEIFGTSWEKKLDPELMEASLSRRTYDPSSVRDCLRMIRNKHHHYDELSPRIKSRIGSSTDGLSGYVNRTFPRLLMHCYHFCLSNLAADDSLAADYNLPIARYLSLQSSKDKSERATKSVIADLSTLEEAKKKSQLETIPDEDAEQEHDEEEEQEGELGDSSVPPELEDESEMPASEPLLEKTLPHSPESVSEELSSPGTYRIEHTLPKTATDDNLSGIVVWSGSNTAKELKCRGWYRSDDEWTQRLDAKLSKRDSNLTRCVDDPKFRTRLCNHWDVSLGTKCPMRKKNKCIFAHGPVELRVKEGKRHRWGTLVNKYGLCANPNASGGEDTYGAARTIEKTRKEQGQWAVDSQNKKNNKQSNKGKQKSGGNKQHTKKKKEPT